MAHSQAIGTVLESLEAQGLHPIPLQLYGADAALTWSDPTADSFGDEALVLLPDMHFSDGKGGDIFSSGGAAVGHRDACKDLGLFLDGLIAAKQKLATPSLPGLRTIQLGDFYDVWRAYPTYRTHPSRDYDKIEGFYGSILQKLIGPLDARFCVGNHDSALGVYPPLWASGPGGGSNGRLAYGQSAFGGDVFALHGHQGSKLVESWASQHGGVFVALGTLLANTGTLSGVMQTLQHQLDASDDEDLGGAPLEWPAATAPKNTPYQCARWAARGGADTIAKIFAQTQASGVWKGKPPRFVFVGHSHRPGISACDVEGRTVPLIDVGSWTYGRTQFALAAKGEISLWELG